MFRLNIFRSWKKSVCEELTIFNRQFQSRCRVSNFQSKTKSSLAVPGVVKGKSLNFGRFSLFGFGLGMLGGLQVQDDKKDENEITSASNSAAASPAIPVLQPFSPSWRAPIVKIEEEDGNVIKVDEDQEMKSEEETEIPLPMSIIHERIGRKLVEQGKLYCSACYDIFDNCEDLFTHLTTPNICQGYTEPEKDPLGFDNMTVKFLNNFLTHQDSNSCVAASSSTSSTSTVNEPPAKKPKITTALSWNFNNNNNNTVDSKLKDYYSTLNLSNTGEEERSKEGEKRPPPPRKKSAFVCSVPECKAVYSTRPALKDHKKVHEGEIIEYSCAYPACPDAKSKKSWGDLEKFQQHIKTHQNQNQPIPSLSQVGFLLCTVSDCFKKIIGIQLYIDHVLGHLKRPFSCPVCPRTCVSEYSMRNHQKLHQIVNNQEEVKEEEEEAEEENQNSSTTEMLDYNSCDAFLQPEKFFLP